MNEKTVYIIKWLFIAIGVYAILSRLWACEDAYITFRYIDNWINGHGLVYNVGDRVEGFTHPLWLFLIAIPAFLGVDIRASALLLSIVISVAALFIIIFRDSDQRGKRLVFPLAAVILITQSGYRDFSVSGLEFPLVALLICWFFVSYKRHDLFGKPILHGTLLVLIYLTRPELILIAVTILAVHAVYTVYQVHIVRRTEALKSYSDLLRVVVPFLLIASTYHIFRYVYYGEFFPNTYFAKQGLEPYWSQGWIYLRHTIVYSPLQSIILAVCVIVGLASRSLRQVFAESLPRKVMLLLIIVLTLYVVRLGGDFMAFRFLLPPLLIAAILVNDFPDTILNGRWQRIVAYVGLSMTVLFVFVPVIAPLRTGYISDERQNYDLYKPTYRALFEDPTEHRWYKLGVDLKALQEETDCPIVLAAGNIGYLGYAAGPEIYILDVYGLVDRQIARAWSLMPRRGRPGHEAKLSLPMAVERRATFFDTKLEAWHQAMATPFGDLITLDPNFLRFYPDNVAALKEFKHRALQNGDPDGSFGFLRALESEYKLNIDSL